MHMEMILHYLAPRMMVIVGTWFFILLACFVDLWSGISTAKAIGQKVYSSGLKKTLTKFFDYWKVCAFAWMFDLICFVFDWYDAPYASVVIALCVLLIEGKSVIENNRRKKSNAGKVIEIAEAIVKATTSEEAAKIITRLSQIVSTVNKNEKWEQEEASADV